MIARCWRGRTPRALARKYVEFLNRTGVAECRATPGNLGVQVLWREVGEHAEFVFLSFWESLEAIRGFAGEEIDRAVFYPEDPEYLVELDYRVDHYACELTGLVAAGG